MFVSYAHASQARERASSIWPLLAETDALREVQAGLVTRFGKLVEAENALRQAQKMGVLGHLTGGVAQDFNNLLAIIRGNLELLRKRTGGDERSPELIELQHARRGDAGEDPAARRPFPCAG